MTATDQSADAAITDPIEAELQAALSAVRTVEARCKDAFLPHLLDHGIVRVEIHYDGGGDKAASVMSMPTRWKARSRCRASSAITIASPIAAKCRPARSTSRML
jgi:hypothetical protein